MIFYRRFLGIFLFVTIYPGLIYAVSLAPDCSPRGLIAKVKEAWNPKIFWATQISEIQDYMEGQKTAYRLSMIQRKRDKINEKLDAEEMKAIGIEQYSDPDMDREMEKKDQEMLQMDRQMLNESIEWGRKCTIYARKKLSQAQ